MIAVQADYWRSGQAVVNFGDFVAELVLPAFGYRFVRYPAAGPVANPGECLYAVGSLFDAVWFRRRSEVRLVIWGCGHWGDQRFDRSSLAGTRVTAVRGPRTAATLGLEHLPTGDPALLLPMIYPGRRVNRGKTLHVCHFHNAPSADVDVDVRTTAAVRRDRWWELFDAIVQADFVLTNAMHAAVVAQAYGVPWALSLSAGQRFDKPAKWADWAAYLGIALVPCSTVAAGRAWWESHGRQGRAGDLAPLIAAFPYPHDGLRRRG